MAATSINAVPISLPAAGPLDLAAGPLKQGLNVSAQVQEIAPNALTPLIETEKASVVVEAPEAPLAEEEESDLSERTYYQFNSVGVTNVPSSEARDIAAVKKSLGADFPSTKARTFGILKGKLVVSRQLPAHLRQGIFYQAKSYPVALRYSSQAHDLGADETLPACSLKIFNALGERLEDGVTANHHTQDFIFNSGSTASKFADARTAREVIAQRANASEGKAQGAPVEKLDYFSQTPYRFGDFVGKHGLFPVSDEKDSETVYEWRWQLCENLARQNVEYSGLKWDVEDFPYQTVAHIVFPKQDAHNVELKSFWENNLRVAPYMGLKAFEPLGSTNRVRKAVHAGAQAAREQTEVRSIQDLPGPLPEGVPRQ